MAGEAGERVTSGFAFSSDRLTMWRGIYFLWAIPNHFTVLLKQAIVHTLPTLKVLLLGVFLETYCDKSSHITRHNARRMLYRDTDRINVRGTL